MYKRIAFIIVLFISCKAQSQILYRAFIKDTITQKALKVVSIENMTTHQGTSSDQKGYFEIHASYGDFLLCKILGYKNKLVQVKYGDEKNIIQIVMDVKQVHLNEVKIHQDKTPYQIDSLERASLYAKVYNYEQQKSVFSPISAVYQKFSKKHKEIRHFQSQIEQMEKDMFIDSRYNPELVQQLTGLQEEQITPFMKAYPMEYAYARAASDLEIKMWIKYNYLDYTKKISRGLNLQSE
ncbi:MAG: carboxypeptidase-like regulatory domain-containing protein [Chitinophagaceae bacterium]